MDITMTNILPPFLGGLMIGVGAIGFMMTHGLIAGISGLMKTSLTRNSEDRASRIAFLVGVVVPGALGAVLSPAATTITRTVPMFWLLPAGLLIGLGSHFANGCTSGHGVCGLARFSPRSMLAVALFSAAGAASLLASRALLGGAS